MPHGRISYCFFKRRHTFKKNSLLAVLLFVSSLKIYSQEIPQLDTLTLNNGLKIYLLNYGRDSILSVKLLINGGKKNEAGCQVGYSEIIRDLLKETLKKDKLLTCQISSGQTILNTRCTKRSFNKEMDLLSSTLSRLCFTKEKIDPIVSSIGEQYLPENISAYHLSHLFRDLIIYGTKDPLGRNYCQYQIQKVIPEELREFYLVHYTPTVSSLVICGNFNTKSVKKQIAKNFVRWKTLRKEESLTEEPVPEAPEIKDKKIALINKIDANDYLLKWVRRAPSSRSPDHLAFLVTCHLFDHFLKEKTKGMVHSDSVNFKPISHTVGFNEINCTTGQNDLPDAIKFFDTILQSFYTLKFTETDLEATVKDLKDNYIKNGGCEAILSFYDPLIYDIGSRKNYLSNLSAVSMPDIQMVLKKYFDPDSYRLIIVGKAHLVRTQLDFLENVTSYETSDFETCDEACKEVIVIKCHCESCYRRGYCNIWRFDPKDKKGIKNAKARAKFAVKQ
jgi:zinc protease